MCNKSTDLRQRLVRRENRKYLWVGSNRDPRTYITMWLTPTRNRLFSITTTAPRVAVRIVFPREVLFAIFIAVVIAVRCSLQYTRTRRRGPAAIEYTFSTFWRRVLDAGDSSEVKTRSRTNVLPTEHYCDCCVSL